MARRLQALSEEAARLASSLLSSAAEADRERRGRRFKAARNRQEVLQIVLELRRLRGRFFARPFSSGPAWDMLLDLAAARLGGRRIAVSSLCAGVDSSATTALRWIRALVDKGLAARDSDPDDRRRIFIHLTPEGEKRMDDYLAAAQRLLG